MKMKKGMVHFNAGDPMAFSEVADEVVALNEEQEQFLTRVRDSIKGYLAAAEELSNGKYSHLLGMIPAYLASPGNALISCGSDGVVVRFERRSGERKKFIAWRTEPLSEFVSLVSQRMVRCVPAGTKLETGAEDGFTIQMLRTSATGESAEMGSMRLCLVAELKLPDVVPKPPGKPFCLLSARSEFNFGLQGELVDEITGHKRPFITSTEFRLPAGWDCIEVFPGSDPSLWIPENAPLWAETDIIASVAARQHHASVLCSLDPRATARQTLATELRDFKALLDSNPQREEDLHVFLKNHPHFLCPSHARFWSKLALGPHVTDFVFCDATGDYLLVEIERPTMRLFIRSGDPSSDLNHALSQIVDWKRYIQDNLSTVQRELGLAGISPSARSLVVIGRSEGVSSENRRKLVAMEAATPGCRLMTYDDVYLNAKAAIENIFGPLDVAGPNTLVLYPRSLP